MKPIARTAADGRWRNTSTSSQIGTLASASGITSASAIRAGVGTHETPRQLPAHRGRYVDASYHSVTLAASRT
jgi:hypothetical protein